MIRSAARYVVFLLTACAALCAAPSSRAGAFFVVQTLREGGCGGIVPAATPLQPNASLTRAAALWAAGLPLRIALARHGYPERYGNGFQLAGPDRSMIALIRLSGCRSIASRQLRDIGVYQLGLNAWVVVGSPFGAEPAPTFEPKSRPLSTSRALQLVNEARARGARCGGRYFPPAPALQLSGVLAGVALGHAVDMADHGYFEHTDRSGESPADRVRAVGYKERLVGENIAYGTESIDETVQGWLDSPDHCENIMDPRFAEMGVADAAGRGLYWVQLLAEPEGPAARIQ